MALGRQAGVRIPSWVHHLVSQGLGELRCEPGRDRCSGAAPRPARPRPWVWRRREHSGVPGLCPSGLRTQVILNPGAPLPFLGSRLRVGACAALPGCGLSPS